MAKRTKVYAMQQLRTANDRNGNPRRIWTLYEVTKGDTYARIVQTRDEGYEGRPRGTGWQDASELPSVDISPSEYRRMLKRTHA